MAHLEHLFAKGIRFDTEVQYLAQGVSGADGLVYQNLPIRKSASAETCALASVIQCLAVLGQLSRQQMREAQRLARKALQGTGDDSVLRCIDAAGLPIVVELHASDPGQAGHVGTTALEALRAGRACLVHFESAAANRWATVIGVEWERGIGEPRALLLLDAGAGEPWACAHNVRIELQAEAGRSVRASPGFTLNCRHLTGEACAVRLRSLIVLRRNTSAGV
ncbi:hypothetical protein [Variovorax sp. 38R]|uniref:hypothetical protein n=1 Tax=Variovorax sp. 38R TaxID=2774875 RepID=UPI0017839F2E|nr:hypothetical protein [Variovorax sp. 38R]QOF79683.1 hypothetical protein IG196_04605 [Variovorax sp. 38R]